MNKIPFNLVVFDTTKGHYGRKDIFKSCMLDLDKNLSFNVFSKKLCHIKISENEEKLGEEMEIFYKNFGFKVIKTFGNFSHYNVNHQQEYGKDIIKSFLDDSLTEPYTLWLESDWKWDIKIKNLEYFLHLASNILNNDKNILTVRFPRHQNEKERIKYMSKVHNKPIDCFDYDKFPDIMIHNDYFSCNPNVCRHRDLQIVALLLKRNFQLANAIEVGLTSAFKWMSETEYSFAVFKPEQASILHCGTKEGEEDKSGQVFEKIP